MFWASTITPVEVLLDAGPVTTYSLVSGDAPENHTLPALPAGSHTVDVSFAGDVNFSAWLGVGRHLRGASDEHVVDAGHRGRWIDVHHRRDCCRRRRIAGGSHRHRDVR